MPATPSWPMPGRGSAPPTSINRAAAGRGTDCLGLLRGIWREMLGSEPEAVPAYTPDWSEPARSEDLLAAAARHLVRIEAEAARPGDVLLLRMREGGVASTSVSWRPRRSVTQL